MLRVIIPAVVVAAMVPIVFFKAYGRLTRPEVPVPVQSVVSRLAPGMTLGKAVGELRPFAHTELKFVPHVGWVGTRGEGAGAKQVRLHLSQADRVKAAFDAAEVEAIEIVTGEQEQWLRLIDEVRRAFPTQGPRIGCLMSSEAGNFREVYLWTTRNDRGGVAIIRDFPGSASPRHPGVGVVSAIAYRGRFAGSRTLRGEFVEDKCDTMSE